MIALNLLARSLSSFAVIFLSVYRDYVFSKKQTKKNDLSCLGILLQFGRFSKKKKESEGGGREEKRKFIKILNNWISSAFATLISFSSPLLRLPSPLATSSTSLRSPHSFPKPLPFLFVYFILFFETSFDIRSRLQWERGKIKNLHLDGFIPINDVSRQSKAFDVDDVNVALLGAHVEPFALEGKKDVGDPERSKINQWEHARAKQSTRQ